MTPEKTKYKHINFSEHAAGLPDAEKIWQCKNNKSGAVLAVVAWYPPWRKWCVAFSGTAVFDEGCLADIEDFLKQLNKKNSVPSVAKNICENL